MVVPCIKELQEANEKVRKVHGDLLNAMKVMGKIWDFDTCEKKGCANCRTKSNGEKYCLQKRCYHSSLAWTGCRIPYMDYCTTSNLEPEIDFLKKIVSDDDEGTSLPEKVTHLTKIENRMEGTEVHVETIPVIGETENCYELKNGDFVYKKNGERRSVTGKANSRGKITIKYYPPTKIDELQDCPSCGKSIFFPFEVIKKPHSMYFTPLAKVCPHCGFEIPVRID